LRAGSFGGGLASGRCASSMLLDDIRPYSNKSNDLSEGATIEVPLMRQTYFERVSHPRSSDDYESKAHSLMS
jgi:hypothetical protein